jgi:CRISPR-associated protein Csb2
MTGGNRALEIRAGPALRWLEELAPPRIVAARAENRVRYRLAVPNNDMDGVARSWARGKYESPARLRTMKDVAPRDLSDPPPHLHYVWPLPEEDNLVHEEHTQTLAEVARCLHTLGWGIDMAFADARVIDDPGELKGETWIPSEQGLPLAVPVPGFYADLKECYRRFLRRGSGNTVDADTRPRMYGVQPYSRRGEVVRPWFAFRLERPRTLLAESGYSRPAADVRLVAAWLRHAAGQALQGRVDTPELNAYVLGHTGENDLGNRLSYLPLPSIGHPNSDGRIRRVLVLAPAAPALASFDLLRRALIGAALEDQDHGPVCRLGELSAHDPVVRRYTARAAAWRTVTPVILHGHNGARGRISVAKTVKLLRQALAESGYGGIQVEIEAFQPAPFFPGLPAAFQIEVPAHLRAWPRYHAAIRFARPVAGPVVAGIGRHYGIGLFAPIE